MVPEPVLPEYGGACIDGVVSAIFGRHEGAPPWLPAPVVGAAQVVLLVLDGLGWDQLAERNDLAPTLAAMTGGPITSVAPTTTATALTSIATGRPPAAHGVIGYRVRVGDGIGEVMNVLRWRTPSGDARHRVDPATFATGEIFAGSQAPVVTRAEFAGTGFTMAAFRDTRLSGYVGTSGLVLEVGRLVSQGEPFVYAYYDGIDKTAHTFGLEAHYDAEVRYADRLVSDILAVLPPDAALVVTADHGQVDVGDNLVDLDAQVLADADLVSGEARFRWIHARPGTAERVRAAALAAHGDHAWVRTLEELEREGWFGGRLPARVAARVGDVAIVPHAPIGLIDPRDAGDARLRSRHGSVTAAEMLVPLVAARG